MVDIHKNPGVGDYAVLADGRNTLQRTWKVERIQGNNVEVSLQVKNLRSKDQTGYEFMQHFLVNPEGKVLSAWVHYKNGQKINRPVAKPNEFGSREHYKVLKEADKKPITTKAGTFDIDEVVTFVYRLDLGLASTKAVFFDHLSNKVPFRVVESRTVSNTDMGVLITTLESVTVAGDAAFSGNYGKVYDYANRTLDDTSVFRLVEYGWGK